MDLWNQLDRLVGKALETERGKRFTVIAVDRDQPSRAVIVEPASTGVPRAIRRVSFDRAETLGLGGSIRPADVIRANDGEFNSAYVATMLRAAHRQEPVS